jgi:AGCS family alanine or glycine:cation symporter
LFNILIEICKNVLYNITGGYVMGLIDGMNRVVWGAPALILILTVGILISVRTNWVQFRLLPSAIRALFKPSEKENGISPYKALCTALAATVGTGNLAGVAGAIALGGPGAIFWMWIIAFFGMATIYAEAVLAQKTRRIDPDGTVRGGPVYYIRTAFKGGFGKFLAGFFAVATIIALGFVGSMVQSNSIATTINSVTQIDPWIVGIIIAVLAALVAPAVPVESSPVLCSALSLALSPA